MPDSSVTLHRLPDEYVIARFSPSSDAHALASEVIAAGSFVSVTRTPQEISIVCPSGAAPRGAELDGPWVAFYAGGPIPFGMTGVVTSLVSPLSAIGSPVFVVSTFDGDVLMVPGAEAHRAQVALTGAGHTIIADEA